MANHDAICVRSLFDDVARRIGRAVVGDDDFELGVALGRVAGERRGQSIALTKLDFGDNVRDADIRAGEEALGRGDRGCTAIQIDTSTQIAGS